MPATPESLLPRSDSKNPATTCRGLTATGRPCRRGVASPTRPSFRGSGDIGNSDGVGDSPGGAAGNGDLASVFCWQHRNQAPAVSPIAHAGGKLRPVEERRSFDTVLEQLGALSIADDASLRSKGPARVRRPREPDAHADAERLPEMVEREKPRKLERRELKPKPRGLLTLLCCGGLDDEDEDERLEIVKHKQRAGRGGEVGDEKHAMATRSSGANRTPRMRRDRSEERDVCNVDMTGRDMSQWQSPRKQTTQSRHPTSPGLSTSIQAQLQAEMSKPISLADEDGYIYIYWITDNISTPAKPLSSFLDQKTEPPSPSRVTRARNHSPVARQTSTPASPLSLNGKLLIKIGRTTNVHKRLVRWTQQCGYNLSLLQYYPHRPTSPRGPHQTPDVVPSHRSDDGVCKVPYSHRVERLIHIELSECKVRQERCESCGKVHREWFEVDASRDGLRMVDEVVERWVVWAERKRDGCAPSPHLVDGLGDTCTH